LEWKASKQWTIGAAYGYGSTDLSNFNFQDTSATITSTINSGALYGVYRPDKQQRWKIAGLFGYSGFSYTGSRSYLGDVASSAYNASGYTGALQASYDIPLTTDYNGEKNRLSPIRIKPMLGLAYGSHQQAGFAESGAGTLVNVQGQTTNSLLGSVGVSLEAPIALNQKKTTVLIPKIGVAYQVDFLADQDGNRSITASLQDDATTSYTMQGQTRASSNLQLNLGADLQLNPKTVLYAGVNYQAFNNGDQFGYQGGLRYKF
jgi:outer membrane autotransporter protein